MTSQQESNCTGEGYCKIHKPLMNSCFKLVFFVKEAFIADGGVSVEVGDIILWSHREYKRHYWLLIRPYVQHYETALDRSVIITDRLSLNDVQFDKLYKMDLPFGGPIPEYNANADIYGMECEY